jgi:hypothetical protein
LEIAFLLRRQGGMEGRIEQDEAARITKMVPALAGPGVERPCRATAKSASEIQEPLFFHQLATHGNQTP